MASISSRPVIASLAELLAMSPVKSKGRSNRSGGSPRGRSPPSGARAVQGGAMPEEVDNPAGSPMSELLDVALNLEGKLEISDSESEPEVRITAVRSDPAGPLRQVTSPVRRVGLKAGSVLRSPQPVSVAKRAMGQGRPGFAAQATPRAAASGPARAGNLFSAAAAAAGAGPSSSVAAAQAAPPTANNEYADVIEAAKNLMTAGGIDGNKKGKQLSGRVRQAWTDECDQVTLDHLKDCLKHKELPNIDYLAEATARSVSAVKSRIRDYHADLYKQCKANAEPPARPPAAASSSRSKEPMLCMDTKLVLSMDPSLLVKDYVLVYKSAFRCGDCRSELLVKPSSPESVKWGPRYRYPVYLPCKYCGNKYTVADLMDAVDAVRSTA